MDNEMTAAPIAPQVQPTKKGGKGAVIGMIFFALVAVGLGVWVAILLLNPPKSSNTGGGSSDNGDSNVAKECDSNKDEDEKKTDDKTDEKTKDATFDYDASKINYADAAKAIDAKAILQPEKIEYTKDGKYLYIIGNVTQGVGGMAAVLYRDNKEGGVWKVLQSGQVFGSCDDYSSSEKEFMENYKYIDDDLESKYVGCKDGDKVFPE